MAILGCVINMCDILEDGVCDVGCVVNGSIMVGVCDVGCIIKLRVTGAVGVCGWFLGCFIKAGLTV